MSIFRYIGLFPDIQVSFDTRVEIYILSSAQVEIVKKKFSDMRNVLYQTKIELTSLKNFSSGTVPCGCSALCL